MEKEARGAAQRNQNGALPGASQQVGEGHSYIERAVKERQARDPTARFSRTTCNKATLRTAKTVATALIVGNYLFALSIVNLPSTRPAAARLMERASTPQ